MEKNSVFTERGRFNVLKMSFLPKLIYGFNVILIKITASCFVGCQQNDFKVYVERPKISDIQHNIKG